MKRKFHLLPSMRLNAVFKDGKEGIVACGAIKSGMWNDERTQWIESEPNEEGEFWWRGPHLIAIVFPRKIHDCNICGRRIASRPSSERSPWERQRMRGFIKPNSIYIGICDNCFPPYWGFDTKICLECAKKIFEQTIVYECDGWGMGEWNKETPKIQKPTFNFIEILNKVVG